MPVIKDIKSYKLLLDTHVWVWLMLGENKFSQSFLSKLEWCVKQENILLSPISIWELSMLVDKRRIKLDMDCMDWVEQALQYPGMNLVPISPRIAVQSARLPNNCHGDPADRMLIATAREQNALLVTHDQKILDYGQGRFISVHDPLAIV